MTIDRGSGDGVQADMAVISPEGVVGRVIGRPAAHAARVQLLIDRNAAAGRADRADAVPAGWSSASTAIRRCRWSSCRTWPTSNVGDVVVTSGVDGIYPKGFVIGRVEKSERGHGLYRQITVRPAVDFSSLEDVLVVLVPAHAGRAA